MTISTIAASLKTYLEPILGFGGRIFINRERPYAASDLPCLEIKFTGEDADRRADHALVWEAGFALVVCVCAAEANRPDLTAEALYQQVKAALCASPTLGNLIDEELEFISTRPEADATGEFVVRKLALDIKCRYTDDLYGDATDALATVVVEIDLSNPRNDPPLPYTPDGQVDARTTIILPT